MKLKHLFFFLMSLVFMTSCNELQENSATLASDAAKNADSAQESSSQAEITEINVEESGGSDSLQGYQQSSFSKYIYVKDDGSEFLVDFNFFPKGTDFDSEKKMATVSCEYMPVFDEELSASLNAPLGEIPCSENVEIDLSQAEFSFLGLVYQGGIETFSEQFDFQVSLEGFVDVLDGQLVVIDSEEADLEKVYETVIEKRLSS